MPRTGQIHRPDMNGESSCRWTALQSAVTCRTIADRLLARSCCLATPLVAIEKTHKHQPTKGLTTTVAKNAIGDRTQATTGFVPADRLRCRKTRRSRDGQQQAWPTWPTWPPWPTRAKKQAFFRPQVQSAPNALLPTKKPLSATSATSVLRPPQRPVPSKPNPITPPAGAVAFHACICTLMDCYQFLSQCLVVGRVVAVSPSMNSCRHCGRRRGRGRRLRRSSRGESVRQTRP